MQHDDEPSWLPPHEMTPPAVRTTFGVEEYTKNLHFPVVRTTSGAVTRETDLPKDRFGNEQASTNHEERERNPYPHLRIRTPTHRACISAVVVGGCWLLCSDGCGDCGGCGADASSRARVCPGAPRRATNKTRTGASAPASLAGLTNRRKKKRLFPPGAGCRRPSRRNQPTPRRGKRLAGSPTLHPNPGDSGRTFSVALALEALDPAWDEQVTRVVFLISPTL